MDNMKRGLNTINIHSNSKDSYMHTIQKKCAVAVLNHNIQLHIRPKFILGFCAGMGYRDCRNSNIYKKVTLPSEFDEILTMLKNKCQVYYDLFYNSS